MQTYKGPTRSEAFIGFVENWLSHYPQQAKTILVFDDATFHCSAEVVKKRKERAHRQLYLQYLPAYGSEFNRLEPMPSRLKHEWIALSNYANGQSLRTPVETILSQFNSKYAITFTYPLE